MSKSKQPMASIDTPDSYNICLIKDHRFYGKGIDVSYYYEGYSEFKTEEL